jgi:hypothetical protein
MVRVRRATARTLLVIAATTVTGFVVVGTADAAVSEVMTDVEPLGGPDATQYPPEEKPTITVDTLPTCLEDTAFLDYDVTLTGTDSDTVTLTWHDPTGDDVVMAGLPLRGRVQWPAGFVGTVDVTFAANPEVTVSVTFPPDASRCLPARPVSNPSPTMSVPTVPAAGDLPRTGVEALPLTAAALGLALVGGAIVALAVAWRRRV